MQKTACQTVQRRQFHLPGRSSCKLNGICRSRLHARQVEPAILLFLLLLALLARNVKLSSMSKTPKTPRKKTVTVTLGTTMEKIVSVWIQHHAKTPDAFTMTPTDFVNCALDSFGRQTVDRLGMTLGKGIVLPFD